MENLVLIENGKAITNSLLVAERFGKKPQYINEAIKTTIRMAENSAVLFYETYYKDSLNKEHPYYLMNRNGFSLLSSWFTGKDAQQIYLDFITDFNEMENQLNGNINSTNTCSQTIPLTDDQTTPRKAKIQNQITMESQIKIFSNSKLGEIRTTSNEQGEYFFCLRDVCKGLSLNAKTVKQRLSRGVVTTYPLETNGGIQDALFINEGGLYDVILDSRKPEAKSFRKWVTAEVLPSIRKTGGYIATKENDTPEAIMERAYVIAKGILDRKAEQIKEPMKQFIVDDLPSFDDDLVYF